MTLEELQILITTETSGLRRELNNVKKELGGMEKAVKGSTDLIKKAFVGVATALATLGIARYVKDAIKAASDLEGAFLGLQSIVEGQGRSFSKAKGFINDYIADGLVPMTDAVNAYKNLAARGYNDDQIEQVMGRLKDAAAFGRQSSYSLGAAVASATEGLKNENSILVDNAGVTKNVAKMWDEYAATIGKTSNNLTQQEKIQAEVNGIMAETTHQVGDAAKYSDTYAGRLSYLNKTLGDIRVNIGQAFMPIANYVIPVLQKLANWLVKVTTYFKYFMQAFFGVSKSQKQVNTSIGDGGVAAQESYGNAAEKASKKVKKAAKEAKGSLAGFDEINSLADAAANAAGSGSGSGVDDSGGIGAGDMGIGDIEMPEIDTETIPAHIQAMVDRIKGSFNDFKKSTKDFGKTFAGIFKDVRPALQPLFDAVGPIKLAFQDIGSTALLLINQYLKPMLGYLLTDFIPAIVTGFIKDFAPVFADIAIWSVELFAKSFKNATNMMIELWNGTWLPSIERLKVAWLDMSSSVASSLQNLLDGYIKPFVDYLLNEFILPISKKIHEVLVPILTDILVLALKEVANTFEWAANMMNDVYNTIIRPVFELIKKIVLETLGIVEDLWKKHGDTLIKNVSELLQNLRDLFQQLWDKVLKPIIQPFLEMLNSLWDKHLKALIKQVGEFIMKLVNGALEILNKFIIPVISYLVDKLAPTFSRIFKLIADIVGTVVGTISDLAKGNIKVLGGWVDFIAGVFTGNWRKAWTGVKDIFKGIVEMISGIFRGVINILIDIINSFIRTTFDSINGLISGAAGIAKKLKIDVEYSPIPVPKIPKLARGGIVNGATNFGNYVAGEAGAEMIVPLENTSFVEKLAASLGSAVMNAMQAFNGSQSSNAIGDVVIMLDGIELGRATAKGINKAQRISGKILLDI